MEELFEKCENTRGAARQQALVQQICTELCVHIMIEEEIFYPACTGEIEDNVAHEAYVEHDGAKVKVLAEDIKHHVKEEERRADGMFAQAKAAGLPLEDLGEQMAARKQELLAQIKAEGLPTLATRSFTGHELAQSKPVEAAAAI